MINKKHCIYLSDTSASPLKVLEFLYKTQNLKDVSLFLHAPNNKIEKNLLDMQSYLLNQTCPITITDCNWKNKESFHPLFQKFLNNLGEKKIIIVIEAQSLKMFHSHFVYKDLIKDFDITMMVFSKPKNLIWTYSSKYLKWLETLLGKQKLYFDQLEEALRNSEAEETSERFEHTIRVLKAAWEIMLPLTKLKNEIKKRVLIACAYHDFSKNWKIENLKTSFLKKHSKFKNCPDWALHGPMASTYLKIRGLVKNPSILKAIECHTLPPKKLGIVGKVVVIADKLEPLKESNFPKPQFQELWSHIKQGNYEYVYEYLRLNPKIKT